MLNLIFAAKKITKATMAVMTIVAATTMLTGCPPQNELKKKAGNSNVLYNIDSTALVNQLAYLSSATMAGREITTPGNQLAREYIVHIFDSLQIGRIGDTYFQTFPFGNDNKHGTNVIGVIKGSNNENNYLAITAHYDHLGVRNGEIYYGTDDNASGTAALLSIMAYFKQHPPKHSLLFVAFDGEEKGLLGSKYFVSHCPVPLSNVLVNVNMDMVSRNDSNEIYATGIYHYPSLKKYVDSIQPYTPVYIRYGHDGQKPGAEDWTNQSDHFPFYQNNIPYLYFGVEDHPDYHRPGDTFDKVNKSFYYQVCTMITAVTALLDQAYVAP
ncbi:MULTISPECIES: M28 family peptidase [Niastella]|uniref:M28 family peptidase n=1 Tax=Niastella soli TaxID=2821487 RepID=A0ABS3YS26_9BACT|nr:M28 family peptidase [Niastella soli]MBO9200006.1 M28 family peptidase [Niastella soli]